MATRSLMALDYANYNTNNILKKHARNRPLGDLEHKHSYIPAQPVLSCRTVDIDLPGTRTYRPRSTVDILEEQQKLIRNLYTKQRAATAAPLQHRTEYIAPPRSAGHDSIRRVNIEVKGRPLTSIPHSGYQNENKLPATTQRRPRTTAGRLKNIQPATDCFMIVKTDKDYVETTRHTRELTNRLRSYWNSESSTIATGRFVRGQKRPDDVPPTLDAWLTFGGAAGDGSEGVIDAFASFKNSQEFYNIEGSVGSRVAQQLQKGDKIRIGINGVLQSQDLKVRRWHKDNSTVDAAKEEEALAEAHETAVNAISVQTEEEPMDAEKEAQSETILEEEEAVEETAELENGHAEEKEAELDEFPDFQDDFKELMIGDLNDMLGDSLVQDGVSKSGIKEKESKASEQKNKKQEQERQRQQQQEENENSESKLKMTIPLSWDDQCTKEDVKVISARTSSGEVVRPVMSETHPVKFEKLINGESRPWLAQAKVDGFRVKQRRGNTPTDPILGRPMSSSKVKVVYIDPLTQEEEERVQGMSVDEIVNFRVREGLSRQNTADAIHRSFKQCDDGLIAINDEQDGEVRRSRQGSSKSGHRAGRPMSNSSMQSERNVIPSPKLKTVPVHSAIKPAGEIGIQTYSSRRSPGQHNGTDHPTKHGKAPGGRLSPAKPLHKAGAGVGSSIKVGGLQGDTEYIKITSQIKNPNEGALASVRVVGNANQNQFTPYNFSPGSNTPRDLDYQEVNYDPSDVLISPDQPTPDDSNNNGAPSRTAPSPVISKASSSGHASPAKAPSSKAGDEDDGGQSESPAPTTVAISIPTADELSDRDSPGTSPVRRDDEFSKRQRKARNMRDEQIDQLTDLLGSAIVDS